VRTKLLVVMMLGSCWLLRAQSTPYPIENIEWTWAAAPEKGTVDARLPNVLLVGDSITRAYYPETAKLLAGKANVYLLATSAAAGDPRLPKQLADYFAMMQMKFAVVQFNNGMHGWGYTEAQWSAGLPEMVAAIRAGAPGAKLIWASVTPVRAYSDGSAMVKSEAEKNARIDTRNALAAGFAKREGIAVENQHALMMQHQDLHSDDVHFKDAGSSMQAVLVDKFVGAALGGK
jgi:hypothetical protein